MPTMRELGWDEFFEQQRAALADPGLTFARVAVEYQDRYHLVGERGSSWAQLSGKLRHELDRLTRPAVGDWVAVRDNPDGEQGVIAHVLTRKTRFVRQAAGTRVEPQVVAANLDTVLVVTAFDDDFNPRRLERYLSAVWDSGAAPVIVVNKVDLCRDREPYTDALDEIALGVPRVAVSARTGEGMDDLRAHIAGDQGPGRTAALLGSSGVGKSTLVNALIGHEVQKTAPIRESDGRGRHTTTHRELILLPGGGILIDTPGMRELKLWVEDGAIGEAFDDIEALAEGCRFADCAHEQEPDCAVRAAARAGELDAGRLASYFKQMREQARQGALLAGSERYEQRRQGKRFAKLVRNMKKIKGK